MLEQGKNKAKNLGYNSDRIEFRQLDAESLPFEDNNFEVVMTGMAFGLFPDQEKAVKEMYRVLRPEVSYHWGYMGLNIIGKQLMHP